MILWRTGIAVHQEASMPNTRLAVISSDPSRFLRQAERLADTLISEKKIGRIAGNLLQTELALAARELAEGRLPLERVHLGTVMLELDLLVRLGLLAAADACKLQMLVNEALN
jgi:hypothetical protein